MGFFLIYDILHRIPYAKMFYSDEGVLPRGYFLENLGHNWSASLMFINGTIYFTYFYFFIYLLLSCFFLIGCRTRIVTILLWLFTLSVHDRNWDVLNAGDDIVRMYFLIACFLPLGDRYSIDNALRSKKDSDQQYSSIWVFAYYFQIALIYFITFLFKTGKEWRIDFTATEYALGLNQFVSPIGALTREFPGLLKVLTFFSIYGELICPLLLMFGFLFFKNSYLSKFGAITLGMSFHLGLIILMTLGIFPFFCLACWVAFLPSQFWSMKFLKLKSFQTINLFYDQECKFCFKIVKVVKEFLVLRDVEIIPAQSDPKVLNIMNTEKSWVLKKENKLYTKNNVFVESLDNSCLPGPLKSGLSFIFKSSLSRAVYWLVSQNRLYSAKVSSFFIPYKGFRRDGFINKALGLLLVGSLFYWNFKFFYPEVKKHLSFFKHTTRIFHSYQKWSMFSPYPYSHNQWYSMPAEFANGEARDIFDFSYKGSTGKPGYGQLMWMNSLIKKYLSNISKKDKKDRLEQFAKFNCRKFNNVSRSLYKFKIIKYRQRVTIAGMDEAPITEKIIWEHRCFKR